MSRFPEKPKVFLETYGCQMNVYDTELVRSILQKADYVFAEKDAEADVVLLNTCAIRENAHRKIYGRVHALRHQRKENPPLIGILGCMATNLRQELLDDRRMQIDFIAGPDSYKRLPEMIRQAAETGEPAFDLTLSEFETYSDVYPSRESGPNAWIAVMRGCNNFCTFCVVPYTRGRERSRSVDNVVEECRRLAAEGFKQVTLLGQNVNSYRHGDDDFAALIEAVSRVEGIERIRFTSPHPKDFPARLIDVVADNPKVCKHIHLPLQSGSDRVLEMMNRTYTRSEFLDLAARMRSRIPGLALSTDIIVGFPTETDAEFEDTARVMEEVEFDSAFIFKYSERKHTMAARKFPDDVTENDKTTRIVRLNELQTHITYRHNQALVGQTFPVMVEKTAGEEPGERTVARTDHNRLVHLEGLNADNRLRPGDILDARITAATPHALKGQPAASARPATSAS